MVVCAIPAERFHVTKFFKTKSFARGTLIGQSEGLSYDIKKYHLVLYDSAILILQYFSLNNRVHDLFIYSFTIFLSDRLHFPSATFSVLYNPE